MLLLLSTNSVQRKDSIFIANDDSNVSLSFMFPPVPVKLVLFATLPRILFVSYEYFSSLKVNSIFQKSKLEIFPHQQTIFLLIYHLSLFVIEKLLI
jgi:hypothetical protein